MHKILQQLLNRTFTYYHQISCKTEGDIKQKLLYSKLFAHVNVNATLVYATVLANWLDAKGQFSLKLGMTKLTVNGHQIEKTSCDVGHI